MLSKPTQALEPISVERSAKEPCLACPLPLLACPQDILWTPDRCVVIAQEHGAPSEVFDAHPRAHQSIQGILVPLQRRKALHDTRLRKLQHHSIDHITQRPANGGGPAHSGKQFLLPQLNPDEPVFPEGLVAIVRWSTDRINFYL